MVQTKVKEAKVIPGNISDSLTESSVCLFKNLSHVRSKILSSYKKVAVTESYEVDLIIENRLSLFHTNYQKFGWDIAVSNVN